MVQATIKRLSKHMYGFATTKEGKDIFFMLKIATRRAVAKSRLVVPFGWRWI